MKRNTQATIMFVMILFGLVWQSAAGAQPGMGQRGSNAPVENSLVYLPMITRPDCSPANGIRLQFGDVTTAAISAVSEKDAYNFCGSAGDVVRLDISQTSSSFNPDVDIYRPDGTLLCSDDTVSTALSLECTLDASGPFVILIGDWSSNNTGGYAFYLQRLNNPNSPTAVDYSGVETASIASIVEHDTYTFSGSAGDIVRLDISQTSGSLSPDVDIYRANGTLLCSDDTVGTSLSMTCTLDVSGVYFILVGDWAINDTGGYAFYLQRLNNPSNITPVDFSDVVPATTGSIVEHDTYTFNGTAGDIVRLDISQTSGSLSPDVDIYRANGTLLCSDDTVGTSLSMTCTLDVSGVYFILVGDWAINDTGGYAFYLQRLNNPSNITPVDYSGVVPATTSSIVEHDTYTFNGTAGDIVRLDISQTSGSFSPDVDIYRANGTLLCTEDTVGTSLSLECTLDTSGTFIILVGDWAINDTGGYAFYLQRLNNPSNPTAVDYSGVVAASIASIVEHDTYTFSGTAGDIVRLDVSQTSGSFSPDVDIYRANGTLLCSEDTVGALLSLECTLDTSGTFVILVGDWAINDTGGYAFYLQRLNNPSNATAVGYGDTVGAAIASIVEHDTYTFNGTAGDLIRLDISRTSGSFNPDVDIYRGNGTLLCAESTVGTTLSLECTLDTSGSHVILVGDWAINDTGGYEFSLTKLN